jgi:chemotaxis response regulator CheB
VNADRLKVLVLYRHPLLGEGLERMLAAEGALEVTAVRGDANDAVAQALAIEPEVIVLEEGGPLAAAEILGRTGCPVVIDVDIASSQAWTYRRDAIRSRPDDVLAAIVAGVTEPAKEPRTRGRRPRLHPAVVPS